MSECVFANEDLVHLILQQAELRPSTFVAVSRVCKGWRAACMRDHSLLMKVVAESAFLTKTVLMGIFALSSAEANKLPRTVCQSRFGGVMYKYLCSVTADALEMVRGSGWHEIATEEEGIGAGFYRGRIWRKLEAAAVAETACVLKATLINI